MSDVVRNPRPAVLLLLATTGCSLPPEPPPPALELPPLEGAGEDLTTWWTRFSDPQLDALLARVLDHNPDLAIAAARVDESAALLRIVDDSIPDATLRAGVGRSQTSDVNAFPRFAGIDRRNMAHNINIDVAWEADLWGRVRAANRAAAADLLADQEAANALRSSLAAIAAQTYFRLVATDRKIALTEESLQNRQDALRIQQRRLLAGTGSQLEVRQAESDAEAVAATLPRLRLARGSTERALLVLAGAPPKAIAGEALPRAAVLPVPPPVPEGLPADLLARRPDVRQAEAVLAATSARVSEARARYFPQIVLTASGGQESKDLGDLFTAPATVWSLAASLTQPLLGLRKIDAGVDAAEARRRAAEASYVKVVQTAFTEIYDALGARTSSHDTQQSQLRRIDALRASERIADQRHTAGTGGFFDLLDARRNLIAVQTDQIDTAADELVATIDVYRALGGGWRPEPPADAAAAASR